MISYIRQEWIRTPTQMLIILFLFCSFDTLFPAGSTPSSHMEVVLKMTADRGEANSCGSSNADLPSSLSTGGFDKF